MGDDLGMVQEAVQDGANGRDVAEELAPFLYWPVAGHDRGAVLVAAHDHLKEGCAGISGQLFQPHVVDDQQVGFQMPAQRPVLAGHGLVAKELALRGIPALLYVRTTSRLAVLEDVEMV